MIVRTEKLAVQVMVLDYFPAFRRRQLRRPSFSEMLEVKRILEERDPRTVIVQTEWGHIGPSSRKLGYSPYRHNPFAYQRPLRSEPAPRSVDHD